jgi:hypothetical protein
MANGTLKVSNIQTSSGSGTITLGQSGETVDFSNATTTLNSAMKNTPAFFVKMDATQTVATNTWTKLELDAETYDTDNAFASYKFTVPSGEGGKYLFVYGGGTDSLNNSSHGAIALYKNGSVVNESFVRSYPNSTTGAYPAKSCVLVLAASDYVELYGQHTKGSNAEFNLNYTFLQGHKLIGA